MATTIKLKNSVTTTNAPSSLVQGEVAINITDRKVWVGNAATTPVQLLGDGATGNFTSLTVSGNTSLNTVSASGLATFNTFGSSGVAITGGSINGTTIGASTASTGAFTTLSASSTATLNTFVSSGATITGGTINGTSIGASTASTGAFTTLSSSGLSTLNSLSVSTTLAVTGVSTFATGSASLPSITTTGDTNTGIFFPAADTIAFSEGGVESMRIDNAGRLLIGPTTSSSIGISIGNQYGGVNLKGGGGTYANWGGDYGIYPRGGVGLGLASIVDISFEINNGTEAMRITSTGSVGIGTNSPSSYGGQLINYKAGGVGTYFGHSNSGTFPKVSAIGLGSDAVAVTYTSNGSTFQTTGSVQIAAIQSAASGAPTDLVFYTNQLGTVNQQMRITGLGDQQFNSGYGSVATAYGCRAWVNFNGTGTVAIRASGNVSSITDLGTGSYGANFTNAMPDTDYCTTATIQVGSGLNPSIAALRIDGTGAYSTTQVTVGTWNPASLTLHDSALVCISVFR